MKLNYYYKYFFRLITTSSYEIHESKEQFEALTQEMATFRTNYENTLKRMSLASHSVALVYDEAMMKHFDNGKYWWVRVAKVGFGLGTKRVGFSPGFGFLGAKGTKSPVCVDFGYHFSGLGTKMSDFLPCVRVPEAITTH